MDWFQGQLLSFYPTIAYNCHMYKMYCTYASLEWIFVQHGQISLWCHQPHGNATFTIDLFTSMPFPSINLRRVPHSFLQILREKLGLSDEQLTALRSQGVVA